MPDITAIQKEDSMSSTILVQNVHSLASGNTDQFGRQTFPCSLCKKIYKDQYALYIHMSLHTSPKKFHLDTNNVSVTYQLVVDYRVACLK